MPTVAEDEFDLYGGEGEEETFNSSRANVSDIIRNLAPPKLTWKRRFKRHMKPETLENVHTSLL